MWTWLVATALAAPVGFWHPDDLAPRSERFVSSSEKLQQPFGDRSTEAESLANALREYREALDLLGERAPAAERERLDAMEREFQRQHAVLQDFANRLIDDYDAAFMVAVERAVKARGEVVECQAMLRTGPALPGVPSREQKNPECKGEDLNAALAAAVDADPALSAAIDELLARPWPELGLESAAQAPVGGTERWIAVRDLLLAGARPALQKIDAADDEARMKIEAAIEGGATVEELKALEPEAERIDRETAAKRAALAAPVLAAAESRMAKKWAGEPATGWCANPTALGGCTGKDESRVLVARLLEDKKVAKALPE